MKSSLRRFWPTVRDTSLGRPESGQLAWWLRSAMLSRALSILILAGAPASAQDEMQSPGEPDATPYRLTSQVVVTLSGATDDAPYTGRVFSQGEGRYLLAFESGDLAQMDVGNARVLWWAEAVPMGATEVSRPVRPPRSVGSVVPHQERLVFLSPSGLRLRLEARNHLVGRFEREQLEEALPGYRNWASKYEPDERWLEELGEQLADRELQVMVFLGSWCAACERFVPRTLALADRLAGFATAVRFVGVRPTENGSQDPEVVLWGIDRLPAAVIFEREREIGRLVGPDAFRRPERSLARLLAQP